MSRKTPVWLVQEGQIIRGQVMDIASFGVFIELIPNTLDGLLEFAHTPYVELAENLKVGDVLEVMVDQVDLQKEKVRLRLLPDSTKYEGFWNRG
jgi:ribosomal protein S1